jgi:predicted aminopeptidase
MKHDFFYIFLPVGGAVAVVLFFSALFSGCYTLKQGAVMFSYLGRAVPLESLKDSEEDRLFVERIRDIRSFAMKELGLKESRNYTTYVRLDRNYLAAIVSASAQDSFKRHEWHYPVVGTMPYKGFFDAEDARREAEKLRKRNLDVWIRPVDAFSTLGWFRDPLYSFMRDYRAASLANLILHELLHSTIFITGQVQFNEELAEFVGTEGARLYIESRFGRDSAEYREILDSEADNKAYVAFIQELCAELETVYSGGGSREEKLAEKAEVLEKAKRRFDAEYESRFKSENYRAFSGMQLNNAYLELFRLYYGGGSYYRELYEFSGGDLPLFIEKAKALNKSRAAKKDPKTELEKLIKQNGVDK